MCMHVFMYIPQINSLLILSPEFMLPAPFSDSNPIINRIVRKIRSKLKREIDSEKYFGT